ncbi:hypothetical protein KUTeg_015960 [Tegillarca granosa]|uniref:Uncharacterized protein n=1 Tax=Tegillarca granosa TaxID=220873 RepID=A0ABQ9EPT0_TEGGR|nr:hypothetical protein KUTeg_015960 [Tegillarca granosa]
MQMQVHWPQIKHVPVIHRIKPPADELLQESERYRKGHSIFMARILQKYAVGEKTKRYYETQRSLDKENIAEGYVQTMIKRLSREGTPDQGKSSGELSPKTVTTLSMQKADSPRARSDFVKHIVRKLSSPSGPEQVRTVVAPLKDLTNGSNGKKVRQLAEAFNIIPRACLSDSECHPLKSVISKTCYHRPHDSLNLSYDSSSQSTLTSQSLSAVDQTIDSGHKPDSTISAQMECYSLPLISVKEDESFNGYREGQQQPQLVIIMPNKEYKKPE